MKLGERLFEYRRIKGLSQEEVASKLNVTRQTISKWETDQTVPDFDKIVPICELFGITTDELLTGNKKESYLNEVSLKTKKNKAVVISTSVFLYFLSIIWIILAEEIFELKDGLSVSIFMFICSIASIILIYYFTVNEVQEKVITKKKSNKNLKSIIDILAVLFTIIYLVISFLTFAWHITWIIWVIYALVVAIVKLIYNEEEENE